MGINARIEKQVHRHPTRASCNAMLGKRAIEIVRTVGVTRIADIIIIFCGACHRESIMPPNCILHDLDKRQHVLIIIFRMQSRHRIGMAHQRSRRGDVESMFNALIEFACRKALEIRALSTINIDDLNKVACFDEIGFSRCRADPEIQNGIGEGVRQCEMTNAFHRRPLDSNPDGRRGFLPLWCHWAAGGCYHEDTVALSGDRLLRACGRRFAKHGNRLCLG